MTGFSNQLTPAIKKQLFEYRYEVFVEKLGWNLKTKKGIEVDQFDHDDTLYVVAKDDFNDVVGCARLLPTTESYLLEEVFPELLNGREIPKSPDVWEISRFTNALVNQSVSDEFVGEKGQVYELSFSKLLKAAIQCAKQHGAKKLISVSPVGIERLLRKAGIDAHRAGPPMVVGGHAIVACWIDIN